MGIGEGLLFMNKKVFWFLGFLIVAAISCWATATSFQLMMPGMLAIWVWGMTIVFFVLASYAVKLIFDAINNDGSISHPKAQMWGGVLLLVFTWIIISLPTNAHTFFYKLKIGDVTTDDLKTTEQYSLQIANRTNVDSAYFVLEKQIINEWGLFRNEAINGYTSGQVGFGPVAMQYFNNVNALLGGQYQITTPSKIAYNNRQDLARNISQMETDNLKPALDKIKSNQYMVSISAANDAKKDVANIRAMQDSIHFMILFKATSSSDAEPVIKQAEGVLVVAYANIKNNVQFVSFNNLEDKNLYTANPLETKTTRFLNPYSVAYDYFTGKIPFSFTFWLLLSILIDVAGFFFFDMSFKKEYPF